ncbi:interleukin-17 receptor A isoform X2 [Danio rerio]
MDCSQKGLVCAVHSGNCSDEGLVVQVSEAPGSPVVTANIGGKEEESGLFVPIIDLRWSQLPDSRIYSLKGTEVRVLEMATNRSVCVRYVFSKTLSSPKNPRGDMWTFSLDKIVIIPDFTYQVFVTNLPKTDLGNTMTVINMTVPERIWATEVKWSVKKSKDDILVMTIEFEPGEFSDQYKVSICSPDFHPETSQDIIRDNGTLMMVKFTLEAWKIKHCNLELVIQPLSVKSMKNCLDYRENVDICPFLPDTPVVLISLLTLGLLIVMLATVCCCIAFLQKRNSHKETPSSDTSTCAKSKLEMNPVQQEHKKLIIIYSLDHPLYKEIVLKLCAFLRAKCGTDVTLDLLDSTWLSTIGRIQWLDMQRERIAKSSDKVLILCSPGVYAKWKSMCGKHQVRLKEDERSPMGDMLTPALSLIIPDFIHASSFNKYMVAYFDDVCSEVDVPAPFNVLVKYKLMNHFEELYFRILDMEKHEPGRIKCIEGIRENDYFCCPSGRALRDAIEVFRNYQVKNPNWFEMELLDSDDEDESIMESMFPKDVKCNPYQLVENYKPHAFVNVIQIDEDVFKNASIAETAIILSEHSSVSTTGVHSRGPGLSSLTTIDVKGLAATKPVAQHALCLQAL